MTNHLICVSHFLQKCFPNSASFLPDEIKLSVTSRPTFLFTPRHLPCLTSQLSVKLYTLLAVYLNELSMAGAALIRCVFACLVWISHASISHAGDSKVPSEICVESWDFTWTPKHYSIAVELDPSNQTFKGNVTIEGVANEETKLLELNCESLTVHKVSLDSAEIQNHSTDEDLLIIRLNQTLQKGSKFVLNIVYDGVFHESHGIIMRPFQRKNSYMIATNLEPVSARRVFPCIDFPRYKATFDVAVRRPEKGLKVISNMPEKNSSDSESEWVLFQRTPNMSTYLVAFMVTDFFPVAALPATRYKLTTDIKIWVPKKTRNSRPAKWAAAVIPEILFYLQDFTGSNFTLPKLDLVSIPAFEENVGGMENWGLIVIRAKSLMHKRPQMPDEMEMLYTITHELAHDWFGNLVTVEDWCSVWIQEALATYVQAIIPTESFGNVDMVNLEKWFARQFVLGQECQSTDLRSLNMDKTSNSSSLFDVTDYHKGAVILLMLESVVTRPVFRQALRKFIENNRYGYVTDTDFWKEVEDSANANGVQLPSNITEIMHSWVNQGGHPIVHVNRDENGAITFSQTLCSATREPSNFSIPLTYTTKSENNFDDTRPNIFDMEKADFKITLNTSEWIILNIENSGVYRVNYDSTTWSLLVNQLKDNHSAIHPVNRAILIDDAFNLAAISLISYSVPLRLIGYLGNEYSYNVWEVVHFHILEVTDYDKLPSEEEQLLKKYIGNLLAPVYSSVAGYITKENWTHHETKLAHYDERKFISSVFGLANLVGYPPYRRDAVAFIENVAANRTNNATGFCDCAPREVSEHSMWSIALAEGSPSLFDLRVQNYAQMTDRTTKSNIADEIIHATSNVTRLLHWLTNIPMNDEIWDYYVKVVQDSWPTKCNEIWAYFEVHWLKLKEAYDAYYEFMVEFGQNVPPTPDDKEEVASLMQRYVSSSQHMVDMTTECSDLWAQLFNITKADIYAEREASDNALREATGEDVLEWLKQQTNKTT